MPELSEEENEDVGEGPPREPTPAPVEAGSPSSANLDCFDQGIDSTDLFDGDDDPFGEPSGGSGVCFFLHYHFDLIVVVVVVY